MEHAFEELRALRSAAIGHEWNDEFLMASLIWQMYRELFNRANPGANLTE